MLKGGREGGRREGGREGRGEGLCLREDRRDGGGRKRIEVEVGAEAKPGSRAAR